MAKNIIEEITEDTGKVNISDDVVATIAGIAANEIEGVTGMAGGALDTISEKLGTKKGQKGVKVQVTPEGAVIDLYIVVEFGVRIPELAWEVQENVKNSVESMTGIDVQKVNVRIEGVNFEKKKKAPKKAEEKAAQKDTDEDMIQDAEQDVIEVEIIDEE